MSLLTTSKENFPFIDYTNFIIDSINFLDSSLFVAERNKDKIWDIVNKILVDDKFREDPKQFLIDWNQRRGWVQIYECEDAALDCFLQFYPQWFDEIFEVSRIQFRPLFYKSSEHLIDYEIEI